MDNIKMISDLPSDQQALLVSLFKTRDPARLSAELSKPRAFWDSQPVPKLKDYLKEAQQRS